jgi:hypothetical protein
VLRQLLLPLLCLLLHPKLKVQTALLLLLLLRCSCLRVLDQQSALADVHAVQELADILVLYQALLVDQGGGPAAAAAAAPKQRHTYTVSNRAWHNGAVLPLTSSAAQNLPAWERNGRTTP